MNKRRVLAIDGGGIKGVIPAAFLAALEETTGKRIADHFDLVVGTSTGGIIALGLGAGLSAREILNFYEEHGPTIFGYAESRHQKNKQGIGSEKFEAQTHLKPSIWARVKSVGRHLMTTKHESAGLFAALDSVFNDTKLGDSRLRLVIPAFNAEKCDICLFKTRHHPRLEHDWKERMVDVGLATAAAPSYFCAHSMPSGARMIDGGVWANTPVAIAVVEALTMLDWDAKSLHVLSLGCGDEIFSPRVKGGALAYASDAIDIILQGQSAGALAMASHLMADREQNRLFRISPNIAKGLYSLDGVDAIPQL